MSVELDGVSGFDGYDSTSFFQPSQLPETFHKAIFLARDSDIWKFSKNAAADKEFSFDQKVSTIARNCGAIKPMKNTAGASVEGKTDINGNSSVDAEVHVSVKDSDSKVSVSAEGSVKSDRDGNISTEGGFKVSYEKEF